MDFGILDSRSCRRDSVTTDQGHFSLLLGTQPHCIPVSLAGQCVTLSLNSVQWNMGGRHPFQPDPWKPLVQMSLQQPPTEYQCPGQFGRSLTLKMAENLQPKCLNECLHHRPDSATVRNKRMHSAAENWAFVLAATQKISAFVPKKKKKKRKGICIINYSMIYSQLYDSF